MSEIADSWGNPIPEKAMLEPGGVCNWCGSYRLSRDNEDCKCTFTENHPKPSQRDYVTFDVIDVHTGEVLVEKATVAIPEKRSQRTNSLRHLRRLGVTDLDQDLVNTLGTGSRIVPHPVGSKIARTCQVKIHHGHRFQNATQAYERRFGAIPFGLAAKLATGEDAHQLRARLVAQNRDWKTELQNAQKSDLPDGAKVPLLDGYSAKVRKIGRT